MYNGSTILLCVTIFVIHKQCLIRAHCSIVTVDEPGISQPKRQLLEAFYQANFCEIRIFRQFFRFHQPKNNYFH
jgi:hypothetical protein